MIRMRSSRVGMVAVVVVVEEGETMVEMVAVMNGTSVGEREREREIFQQETQNNVKAEVEGEREIEKI